MPGLEDAYVNNIDNAGAIPSVNGIDDIGMRAEDLVIEFFNDNFPGQFTVRPATPEEDSGVKQIRLGRKVDAVVNDETGKPIMCMQITTARDRKVVEEKMRELMSRPFIRLEEMTARDHAIPKVFIKMDPVEAGALLKDHDFSRHPKISEQILESVVNSLTFILAAKTDGIRGKEERDRVRVLLNIFEKRKGETQH